MEQYTRFELVLYPWQGHVLPLHQYCIWLSGRELNPRPHDYQSCALTNWATKQYKTRHYWFTAFYHWTNPLYQGAKAPLNSSPITTLPGELWQGMKGIEPTLPAWQAIKIAVNVFNSYKYYNIFFEKCQIFLSSGRISAAAKYPMTPTPNKITLPAQIKRTIVGSQSRYSAIPPQTPKILYSVLR